MITENTAQKGGGVFIHLTGAVFYDVDFDKNNSDNSQGNNLYIFTMEEDLSVFLNSCQFKGVHREGDLLQEAYNSNNYIFIEESILNYHGIIQKEKLNGSCKAFYDGNDIFQNALSAERKKD